jgi:hypothetical protein
MDEFFESFTDAQLLHFQTLIGNIRKKRTNLRRILVSDIDTSAGYKAIHDQFVTDMKHVRSIKIFIDEEQQTAKISFRTPALASAAKELLDELYDNVKLY